MWVPIMLKSHESGVLPARVSTFQHHERLVKCVIWNLAQIPGKDVTGIRKWICVVNGLLMSQDLPSEVFNMENVLVRFQLTNSIQYLRRWEQGKMTLTPVNGTLSDCYIQTIHPLRMLNTGRLTLNCCHILFGEIILTSWSNRPDRNCCFYIST